MKRWLIIPLLLLFLCSCTYTEPEKATQPVAQTSTAPMAPEEATGQEYPEETTQPMETEPEEWPEGSVEYQTDGALLTYKLTGENTSGVCFMGQNILVFYSNGGITTLQLLSTSDMSVLATAKLTDYLLYFRHGWAIGEDQFAYYSGQKKAVIFLDSNLEQARAVPLPEDVREDAVISRDMKKAYYSTGSSICCIDLETGESTVLAEIGGYLTLEYVLFEDTVIYYSDPWGTSNYLSTQTGQLIRSDSTTNIIKTTGDRYFLSRVNDGYTEYLFGTFSAEQQSLVPKVDLLYCNYLPGNHAVVLHENGGGTVPFDYYDLSSGKRIASMNPDFGNTMWFSHVVEDPSGDYLWFTTMDNNDENVILYRWDFRAMPTGDEHVYTGQRWTADNPDWDGIAQCRERADAMEETYGVEILLHTQAEVPQGYGIRYLYQVHIIEQSLDSLEAALSQYPEGFFRTLGKVSQSGKVQISLARRIETDSDWIYYDCLQYWQNGNACIVVQAGSLTGRLVNRGVGFVIEKFLRDKGYLDTWEELNPEGFSYCGSYEAAMGASADYSYRGTYFVDQYSKISAAYDVAELMEYAMIDGVEDYLRTGPLQKKLGLLCRSIREAFALTESQDVFPWERYLSLEGYTLP